MHGVIIASCITPCILHDLPGGDIHEIPIDVARKYSVIPSNVFRTSSLGLTCGVDVEVNIPIHTCYV